MRVLGKCGGYAADIADAIYWSAGGVVSGVPANANPVQVINLSLGGRSLCPVFMQNAINFATSKNVTVVTSAGNNSEDASNFYPGNCAGVINVAATRINGGRASYSNFGRSITISAPGGDSDGAINVFGNFGAKGAEGDGYVGAVGTSYSAPMVSGVIALMLSKSTGLTPAQVKSIITSTAKPFPAVCDQCGSGIIDAAKAVAAVPSTVVISNPCKKNPAACR